MHRLRETPPLTLPPKARLLSQAASAGLPVPEGVISELAWNVALEEAVAVLLERGPVIVRAALEGEDGPSASAAGLGSSIPGCADVASVRAAVTEADAARRERWLVRYRGMETSPADRVIVQHQVERVLLVVGALLPCGTDYVEVHGEAPDALAQGDTPIAACLVERWSDPRAEAVAELLARLRASMPMPPHGYDVELIVDPDGRAHLVQLRPLTGDLIAHGRAFVRAVHAAGQADRLGGVQVLDAEHNPAPLSPAHASLIAWLALQRPSTGGLTTLAGWLFTRRRVRDLPGEPSQPALSPTEALQRLRDVELPAARARMVSVEANPTLEGALQAFLAMIDVYLGVLLPARAAAGHVRAEVTDDPLSLRERSAHADVLPAAWDVAAPTLAELGRFATPRAERAALPSDPMEAAVLLTEWDDHLFALGLAPVRAAYRDAGRRLGLDDAVFGLTIGQLRRALDEHGFDAAALAQAALAQTQRWAELRPPAMLDEGRPLPHLPHRTLQGTPVGDDFEGPIAQRADLADLLRRPPDPSCIVVLPALTAQAALALQSLDLRAVCCEHGGALSHAALMLRELGASGLIGCVGCTRVPDGTLARIVTATGRLQITSSVTLGS